MNAAHVFHALGDPMRLQLVERLATREPCSISELSRGLTITRQGARKHLQVLADAGIVALEAKGRECRVKLRSDRLDEATAFLERLGSQWERRLEALRRSVEEP